MPSAAGQHRALGRPKRFRSTRNGGQERNRAKQCCRSLGHFPPEQHVLPWVGHHGKCHTTTCKCGITALPAAAPQRKPTGLLDHHSTDRCGQSGEDGHVRKTLVLVSAKNAGMKYFPFWPQTGHCSLQSSAWDCTEKCQEDFMLDLQTASPDSKRK